MPKNSRAGPQGSARAVEEPAAVPELAAYVVLEAWIIDTRQRPHNNKWLLALVDLAYGEVATSAHATHLIQAWPIDPATQRLLPPALATGREFIAANNSGARRSFFYLLELVLAGELRLEDTASWHELLDGETDRGAPINDDDD